MAVKIRDKNLSVKTEFSANFPEQIYNDPMRTRQVLINLINNAYKFTEKGSINIKVNFIKTSHEKGEMTVTVQDTGCGISTDDQKTIFNEFEQLSQSHSSQTVGHGLGLSICHKLMKLMNGKISVESTLNQGSIFKIAFYDLNVKSETGHLKNQHEEQKYEFSTANILIVDDEKTNLSLLQSQLKETELKIFCALNSSEALAHLNEQKIDMVLMDLRMPKVNGFELTEQIRQSERWKHLPIIAQSATIMAEDDLKISQLFNTFLRKPIAKNTLLETLSKYLESKTVTVPISGDNLETLSENLIQEIRQLLPDHFSKTMPIHDWFQITAGIEELSQLSPEVTPLATKLKTLVEFFNFNKAYILLSQYHEA